MRVIHLFLVVLLAGVWACSDNPVGLEDDGAVLETAMSGEWAAAHKAVPMDQATVDAALSTGDMVLQMGMTSYYPDPDFEDVKLVCHTADGTSVPGVTLPIRFLVEGKVQHMGKVTGYFGGGDCLINADQTLTIEREWRYASEDGHLLWGTYTLKTRADGSWTSHDVITGGVGKFAGATGWSRSAGRLDTPVVYSKGVVSAPKDVVAMGFVDEDSGNSKSSNLTCHHRDGSAGFVADRSLRGSGLATYLGVHNLEVENESCIDDGDILTAYGTWQRTNAQGDGIHGTHTLVVGIEEPWPVDAIVTGGTGRFEGVTGWMQGYMYWDEGRGTAEGVIFMPR